MTVFRSLYRHGFARVATCAVPTRIADPLANADTIAQVASDCHRHGVALAVFPELGLSGYAIDDLLGQQALLSAVHDGIARLIEVSRELLPVLVVGAPLRCQDRLFNTAVVMHRGRILGVVPKSYLPNYREFYERRQFAPGTGIIGSEIDVAGSTAPFGTDLLFAAADLPGFTLGVEICEDMFMPVPPSSGAALAGATVLANLSGSPVTIGRSDDPDAALPGPVGALPFGIPVRGGRTGGVDHRPELGRADHHRRIRRPAGEGAAFPGFATAHDCRRRPGPAAPGTRAHGHLRRQPPGPRGNGRRLSPDRLHASTRRPATLACAGRVERFPFVPADPARLAQDCYEAYNIQVDGLEQRLRATGTRSRHRGVRRAGLHPRADRRSPGDGSAGPAAHQHPCLHAARLRDRRRGRSPTPWR